MYLSTIAEWLTFIASLHSTEIDLGLTRVKKVAERLNVLSPTCAVIIVAGTNGKGSTVAGLESIYRAGKYQTGVFTSPFLFRYNEQVRLNGQMATDEDLCKAFASVEAARGDISLTPFEFGTLAAFVLFQQQPLDVWILEVGLGGRLDAVNIIDTDVAVVTSIAIDHVNWLGDTREKIAVEKAGIFRPEKPVVCGDNHPPVTLIDAAEKIHAPFYQRGRDFDFHESVTSWSFTNPNIHYSDLPRNHLATQNMATVIQVISLLQPRLPVMRDAIETGLKKIELTGRIQIMNGPVMEIFDVAHNPAAVGFLNARLMEIPCSGKTFAVFSMLEDKDIVGSILNIKNEIDVWYVAPLNVKRGASKEYLENALENAGVIQPEFFSSIEQAYNEVRKVAGVGDRILVFGSFHTISQVLKNKENL